MYIGDIRIQLLQKQTSIEVFEIFAEKEGSGPGMHVHKKMEKTFYVASGSVLVFIEDREFVAKAGDSITVKRNTKHRWQIAEKNTKLLLIFTPPKPRRIFHSARKASKLGTILGKSDQSTR